MAAAAGGAGGAGQPRDREDQTGGTEHVGPGKDRGSETSSGDNIIQYNIIHI